MDRFLDVPAPPGVLGVTLPPLLSYAVIGASPLVMLDYSNSRDQLQGHLFIDHCTWFFGRPTLTELQFRHSICHEHPYWAHHPRSGEILHIHGSTPPSGQELTEWTW
jgi:hypothetical protein